MEQKHARQYWKFLLPLILSVLMGGAGWSQTAGTPAANPAPAPAPKPAPGQNPSPTPSPAPTTTPPPAATPAPGAIPAPGVTAPTPPKVETPIPPEKVVLKIGSQQFTKAQMDAIIEGLPPQTQQALAVQGKKQFGDYFELSVLLSKRAQALHLDQTPDFARKLAFQKQQLEAQTAMAQLAKVTPEDIEQYYKTHADDYQEIMVRQVVVRKKAPDPNPNPKPNPETPVPPPPAPPPPLPTVRLGWVGSSDSVVRGYLEKDPKVSGLSVQDVQATFKYSGDESDLPSVLAGLVSAGVKVSGFDVNKPPKLTPTPATGLTPDEAMARAEAIRKALLAGADIKKLAEEYKTPPGEVIIEPEPRKIRHGGMRPDMEKAAFALKDGEVSEPLDINNALVFFQVTGRNTLDLKAATPEIERKLRQQKSEAAMDEIKKSTVVWMDDQYFAAPQRPPGPPGMMPPGVRVPPGQ